MKTTRALALALVVTGWQPAQALTIDLFDQGGFAADSPQYRSFRVAADYWQSLITTSTTVRVDLSFYGQGINGPTGGTSNFFYVDNVGTVLGAMQAAASNSLVDQTAIQNLPTASGGAIAMWTPGYTDFAAKTGADPKSVVYDNDGSNNNRSYGLTWALAKALGLVQVDALKDGSVNFNSDLAFDYDPTDGITAGSYDFTFTAFHELGHILGFTSGIDYYDAFAPSNGYNWNLDWIGHGMDLFRYSALGLDWSMGGTPYFSIDGGASALLGGSFSTGVNWGNGQQASHWLEGQGLMDPTAARGELGAMNALDVAAFDALGWNVAIDALGAPGFRATTADMWAAVAAPVPEPATWATTLLGLCMLAGAMQGRLRRRDTLAAGPRH